MKNEMLTSMSIAEAIDILDALEKDLHEYEEDYPDLPIDNSRECEALKIALKLLRRKLNND